MIKEGDIESEIKASLTINELDVDSELASIASYYYRFSSLASDAELFFTRKELEMEQYEVNLAKSIKVELLVEGVQQAKITETELKRRYRGDEKWLKLKNAALNAESDFKKLEKAAKAFDMKSQNCMSLNKRQIYKSSKGMTKLEDL